MKLRNESTANDEQLERFIQYGGCSLQQRVFASVWFHNEERPMASRSVGGLGSFAPLRAAQVVDGVPSVQSRSRRSEKYRQFL